MSEKEFTKEQWEKRKLTLHGFFTALIDAAFMGLYLWGGLSGFRFYPVISYVSYDLWALVLAGSAFLTFKAIGMFWNLMHARDHYEVVIDCGELKSS